MRLTSLAVALLLVLAAPAPAAPGDDAVMTAEERRAAVASVRAILQTLNSQVELYQLAHDGAAPDFAGRGWAAFIEPGILEAPPRNPLADDDVATVLVVTDRPGIGGEHLPIDEAGWVWNTTDRRLDASGLTAAPPAAGAPAPARPEPADRSLTVDAYRKAGAPEFDRRWSGRDLRSMSIFLRKLLRQDAHELPRFESPSSGPAFARLCADDNLAPMRDDTRSPRLRLKDLVEYMTSLALVMDVYDQAYRRHAVSSRDLAELYAHYMRGNAVAADVLDDFLAHVDPDSREHARARRTFRDLRRTFGEFPLEILDMVGSTSEHPLAVRRDMLVRMGRELHGTIGHLHPVERRRILARLDALAAAPAMADLAGELEAIAETLREAVAAVE
jgi:hypothetical protein